MNVFSHLSAASVYSNTTISGKLYVLIMMRHFEGGNLKDKVSVKKTSNVRLSNSVACCKLPLQDAALPSARASLNRSFSCFVFVHVFMSLMWFFYPRASSGTLSQERKCGTPAIVIHHMPFVCVRACMCIWAHSFLCRGIHNPPEALHINVCMSV